MLVVKKLGELLELCTYGFTNPMPDSDEGPWKITAKDVVGGRVNYSKARKTTINAFNDKLTEKSKPKIDDILLTKDGTLGRIAIVKEGEICINQSVALLRTNQKLLPQYLYYILSSPKYQNKLLADSDGSVLKHIYVSRLPKMEVEIPTLKDQEKILQVLSPIDDKIELNRQTNKTLETMAQALFKSWFVDFDPVIDNALAAGNPIPEVFAEHAKLRAASKNLDSQSDSESAINGASNYQHLFPAEFEFTEEMGWAPKNWSSESLYGIADFINGASFKSQYFSEEQHALPIIKIAEIKNGVSGQTKFTTQELADKYAISDGEILFSWSGNPETSIDTFVWSGGNGLLNQHIFKVSLKNSDDRSFVYYLLKQLKPTFTAIARDKQTTGLGHVTVKDMKRISVIKPALEVLEAFNSNADFIFSKWYQNLFSTKELTKLRDTLLPKLLSGELRIPDAEKLIAETSI